PARRATGADARGPPVYAVCMGNTPFPSQSVSPAPRLNLGQTGGNTDAAQGNGVEGNGIALLLALRGQHAVLQAGGEQHQAAGLGVDVEGIPTAIVLLHILAAHAGHEAEQAALVRIENVEGGAFAQIQRAADVAVIVAMVAD